MMPALLKLHDVFASASLAGLPLGAALLAEDELAGVAAEIREVVLANLAVIHLLLIVTLDHVDVPGNSLDASPTAETTSANLSAAMTCP